MHSTNGLNLFKRAWSNLKIITTISKIKAIITIKIDNNKSILTIFGLFSIYLLVQHAFVFMYFDDFGYASLTYGTNKSYWTESLNLVNTVQYMSEYYRNWSGRILFHFFYVVLLQLGLFWVRSFQVAMFITIIVSIYYLVIRNSSYDKIYAALLSCFLYGIIHIDFAQHGLYWFAASSIYVWPLAFFLLAVIFLTNKTRNHFLIGLFFFMAGFSQEQIGASVIFFMIFYITYKYFTNDQPFEFKNLLALSTSTIGYLIVYLSPGSRMRMTTDASRMFYDQNIIDRTVFNISAIINTNINPNNIMWVLIMFMTAVVALFLLKRSQPDKFTILYNILIIMGIIFFTLFILHVVYPFLNLFLLKILFVIFIIVSLTLYCLSQKKYIVLGLFYAGIISQIVMILSPALPGRFVLINIFLSFVIITEVFSELIALYKGKLIKLAIVSPIIILSLLNATSILLGYHSNSFPQRINHELLERASELEKSGTKVDEITLLKQINGLYGSVMPYEEIRIHHWIKDYYVLSIDINNFNWVYIYDIAQLPKQELFIIKEIIPSKTQVGVDFQLINNRSAIAIKGENFTRDSVIYFNEIPLATTFGNENLITAFVPKELYEISAEYEVVVQNDKYISNLKMFKVE